ncbi:ATP-dependent Clp protease proteolytic subunit 2, mitochondrial-like [Ananas comosus]|uniref:ATP-dependent Clp protease proteolytic subunit n=1 Tax=Ananas comosus TaxID=4615 RepID=A0A6P5FN72_ANACO|nr:ATP-dependent Clp protease proteolytic subunit 2, mitochondrial-like [Ananas comosus]
MYEENDTYEFGIIRWLLASLLVFSDKERIVYINGPIIDDTTSIVVLQLISLAKDRQSKPVHLLINSPGETVSAGLVIYDTINSPGEIVSAGLVIYDTIQSIPIPVATLCLGQAGSMASLLTVGTLGQRRALPNSCIMIHQPFGGFLGQASDIAIHAKEILKVRDCLYAIHTKHTHQPVHRIEQFMERNIFMSGSAK